MKAYIYYLVLVNIITLFGCNIYRKSPDYLWKKLENHENLLSDTMIIDDSGNWRNKISLEFEGIDFMVCTNNNGYIDYLETNDTNFMTSEGLKRGMKFGDLNKRLQTRIKRGYHYYVPLKSNWNAVFISYKTEKEDSPLAYFYQCPKSLSKLEVFYYLKIRRFKDKSKSPDSH